MADPKDKPVTVVTQNVIDQNFIIVSVRTDFVFPKTGGGVEFHWSLVADTNWNSPANGETIVGATVELLPKGGSGSALDSAVTNRDGEAMLETSQRPDGEYVIRITPLNSKDPLAGPDLADPEPAATPLPERMYHKLDVTVQLSQGDIASASIAKDVHYADFANRKYPTWPAAAMPTGILPIDLRPTWMRSHHVVLGRTDVQTKMIVVHHTGGKIITGTLNEFVAAGNNANYAIDLTGHCIKFVRDLNKAQHAPGKWKGDNPNDFGIGIEIVNASGAYLDVQYTVLIGLLNSLIGAYPIDEKRIVGHSDVAVLTADLAAKRTPPVSPDYDLLDGDRDQDPGQDFEWERLEQAGLGMIPPADTSVGDAYENLFGSIPDLILRYGDNDTEHRYGGVIRKGIKGTPMKDLQQDLQDIGYSIHRPSGTYDNYLIFAIHRFQSHFFSGSRKKKTTGKIDAETAGWIKAMSNLT